VATASREGDGAEPSECQERCDAVLVLLALLA
jgi:hypothetical protein